MSEMTGKDEGRVVRSLLRWRSPPEIGQALEELDWLWIDIDENDQVRIRNQPPTHEEILDAVEELRPQFNWERPEKKL
jgi:hypothetical protein